MKTKYLLIDMDGTINEYYDESGKLSLESYPTNFFLNKRPIRCIIETINRMYNDYHKIIFTASPSEEVDNEKNLWLDKFFPVKDRIVVRYPGNEKSQVLFNFMRINNIEPEQVYVLDDDMRILRQCEKLGVNCLHISHIIAQYEENIANKE